MSYQSENIDVPEADIHIYDGFYLLHSLINVPNTYGGISELILNIIMSNKKEVHIIFVKFNKPSIKNYKQRLRGEEKVNFDIKKENKRASEFLKLLRSSNFKENIVEFLITDWTSHRFVTVLMGKKLKLKKVFQL